MNLLDIVGLMLHMLIHHNCVSEKGPEMSKKEDNTSKGNFIARVVNGLWYKRESVPVPCPRPVLNKSLLMHKEML